MGALLTVAQAAERLGISPRGVHDLLRSRALPAERLGRAWAIRDEDLAGLIARRRPPGRPLSARSCWAVLAAAGGWEAPFGLSRAERARARERAKSLTELPAGALDARADVARWFVHRSLMGALGADRRLCLGGISAAPIYRADIVGSGQLDAYVRAEDLQALVDDYALSPTGSGSVALRVPSPGWPLPAGPLAPPAVVAWDLIDAGDARSERAGRRLLAGRR